MQCEAEHYPDLILGFIIIADMCKRRADEATSSEALAMHRVLSSYVSNAFAARAVHGIQAGMVSAALDVSTKDKKK